MENNWVDVKDRLPEEDVEVLLWNGDIWLGSLLFPKDQYFVSSEECRHIEQVTHWQPLPAPPHEGDKSNT